jgi:hypothetical protein
MGLLNRLKAPVKNRGDEILGLLNAGKADQVTDQMLDMGDDVANTQLNMYLSQNYDLPMDAASRMDREKAMGFNPRLHGTPDDIRAIDPSKLGVRQNLLGKGFYTSTDPNRTDRYIGRANQYETPRPYVEGGNQTVLSVRSDNPFDASQRTGKENAAKIGKAFEGEGSEFDVEIKNDGDQVFIKHKTNPKMSVYIDSYQDGIVTISKLRETFGNDNLTEILENAGFTGVRAPEARGNMTEVSYNPEDVRSRFARFDPRLSHLKNLMASGAGGLLTIPFMEEDNRGN